MRKNSNAAPHSQEFFTQSRDFWWNDDYLALFIKRWKLRSVRKILDVGCGQGHWINALLPLFDKKLSVCGLDIENEHILRAKKRFKSNKKNRFKFTVGDAYRLPYEANVFDMVTCQTLLLHLENPARAIAEMVRVVKPGGLIAVVEPNNMYRAISGVKAGFAVDEILESLKYELMYEKGKVDQLNGYDSYGEVAVEDFVSLGLMDIKVYLSDKCASLIPPYTGAEQQAIVKEFCQDTQPLDIEGELERFILGGGTIKEYRIIHTKRVEEHRRIKKQILAKRYCAAGPTMMIVTSGRKPLV